MEIIPNPKNGRRTRKLDEFLNWLENFKKGQPSLWRIPTTILLGILVAVGMFSLVVADGFVDIWGDYKKARKLAEFDKLILRLMAEYPDVVKRVRQNKNTDEFVALVRKKLNTSYLDPDMRGLVRKRLLEQDS